MAKLTPTSFSCTQVEREAIDRIVALKAMVDGRTNRSDVIRQAMTEYVARHESHLQDRVHLKLNPLPKDPQ